MKLRVVEAHAPPGQRDTVAAWLVERTGETIEEREDGTLVACLAPGTSDEAFLRDLHDAFGAAVTARILDGDPVDWSERWRDGLAPRRFGRLVVAPTWSTLEPAAAGAATLRLDPEMAFGSGEHGSTRAALTLLERHLHPGATVLDLGSGSGILAIAAVLLGARLAIGIEVDEEAMPVAERNAIRNDVAGRVRFVAGEAGALAPLLGPADLVLSNILRTVNVGLLPAIRAALAPGGAAIFSGMEEPEAPLFLPELEAAGFVVGEDARDAGWWAVLARKG